MDKDTTVTKNVVEETPEKEDRIDFYNSAEFRQGMLVVK